jgi:large subunit ribosomal protein L17
MRHKVSGRRFDRAGDERQTLFKGLVKDLVKHERMKTTEAKAKEVRGVVDRMITTAKRGDLQARRALASEMPHEPLIVDKLMGELATKYADRTSGYTRIVKIGERVGDAAPIVQIELV